MIMSMFSLPVLYAGEDIIKLFSKSKDLKIKQVSYVGFELIAGTIFKLNGEEIAVPSSGSFFTPISNDFKISSLEFPNVYPTNVYILY